MLAEVLASENIIYVKDQSSFFSEFCKVVVGPAISGIISGAVVLMVFNKVLNKITKKQEVLFSKLESIEKKVLEIQSLVESFYGYRNTSRQKEILSRMKELSFMIKNYERYFNRLSPYSPKINSERLKREYISYKKLCCKNDYFDMVKGAQKPTRPLSNTKLLHVITSSQCALLES